MVANQGWRLTRVFQDNIWKYAVHRVAAESIGAEQRGDGRSDRRSQADFRGLTEVRVGVSPIRGPVLQ
jgi:hypothetical protein